MKRTAWAFALGCCLLPCALLAAPAAAQPGVGSFADVPGGKLWYETCGSGAKTMVLLHDGVLHSVTWDDVWPALCKSFRVVRYDRRGYGRSPEAKAPYSPVEDVAAVMKAAGMEHAVIVGASTGGGIAIDFTLAHPKQVDGLLVVGPEVSGLAHTGHMLSRMGELQAKLAQGDAAGAIQGSWLLSPGDDANAQRLIKLFGAYPQDMNHQDPATPSPPAGPRLSEIKVPTLVLIGEDDVADNQAEAGVVEYAIHGAHREVIRKAGHLVYMEQPVEFVAAVARFADTPVGPSPGTEPALRRLIEQMRQGTTDYDRMNPSMAKIARGQAEPVKRLLATLGAVRSVTYDSRGVAGADIFVVAFDQGRMEWRLKLGQGGRIDLLSAKPLP